MRGEGPNQQEPLSLSEIVLVKKAFMTHVAQGHLTLLKGTGENIPVAEVFPFVYKFTLD